MARRTAAIAAGAACLLLVRFAIADGRLVEDPAVAEPRQVTVHGGVAAARFSFRGAGASATSQWGSGANLEEAVGLGGGFELGARFGVRLDDAGRGLRADEAARGFDRETLGTGIDTVANPELRLARRVLRWNTGEAAVEARLVLPLKPDPETTAILGAWASLRIGRIARLDAGIDLAALGRRQLAGDSVQAAVGIPLRFWVMVTSRAYLGIMSTTQAFAGTREVDGGIREVVGIGAGYRLGSWDTMLIADSLDATTSLLGRTGLALDVAWRL